MLPTCERLLLPNGKWRVTPRIADLQVRTRCAPKKRTDSVDAIASTQWLENGSLRRYSAAAKDVRGPQLWPRLIGFAVG
jgi:hypothetical protein